MGNPESKPKTDVNRKYSNSNYSSNNSSLKINKSFISTDKRYSTREVQDLSNKFCNKIEDQKYKIIRSNTNKILKKRILQISSNIVEKTIQTNINPVINNNIFLLFCHFLFSLTR